MLVLCVFFFFGVNVAFDLVPHGLLVLWNNEGVFGILDKLVQVVTSEVKCKLVINVNDETKSNKVFDDVRYVVNLCNHNDMHHFAVDG